METKFLLNEISLPVKYLKGVGEKRAEILASLGIKQIEDLLQYYPRIYQDRRHIKHIFNLLDGEKETLQGTIIGHHKSRLPRKKIELLKVIISDGTGYASLLFFNQPKMEKYLTKGLKLIISGRIRRFRGETQITDFDYEILHQEDNELLHHNRIVPIYPLTQEVSPSIGQRLIRTVVKKALDIYSPQLIEIFPREILSKHQLPDIRFALNNIHFPTSWTAYKSARARLIFEEFFLLQLALGMTKKKVEEEKGIKFQTDLKSLTSFVQSLPFTLTQAQMRVIKEILADMGSARPMNRLLHGDVGSGKTIVATCAAITAYENGYQTAIMAPTEILAEQHSLNIHRLLSHFGIKVALLTSSIKKSEREEILTQIKNGEVNIAIGTHALIQEGVEFKKLGLCVIDEQHRFGVMQRAELKSKAKETCLVETCLVETRLVETCLAETCLAGTRCAEGYFAETRSVEAHLAETCQGVCPDVLVMTATPIPRTLALTLYGDLDTSVIDEMPPNRQKVITKSRSEKDLPKIFAFIKEEIKNGRQVYLVYPLVEESEELELKAATRMFEELQKNAFPEFKLGLLHGQLKSNEKDKVMKDFYDKEIDILVSTTVIEVGIDVPNATIMLIEHAERFGLAQLHQLRGRVGRGVHKSYCILVTKKAIAELVNSGLPINLQEDPDSTILKGAKRLATMCQTSDGFEIAQVDLELRGAGEFFGTRQHGMLRLKLGNIIYDAKWLELARKEAFNMLDNDPSLKAYPSISKTFAYQFKDKLDLVEIG
ncbi:MAG: ATP-dependent DNA helicase RecG [bacterium]|nr:ATP-dependent DNA helicase RecG [bacterium]